MWQIVWNWFSTHEWLAIWLEGIALVALFVLEFRQFRSSSKETLVQIEIAKKQAEAATLTAQSVMNSERAWLTADLEWVIHSGRILFSYTPVPPGSGTTAMYATSAAFVLKLRNDGRTPGWIETISAGMELSGTERQPELPTLEYIEPLGAEKSSKINLTLECPGRPKIEERQALCVHITITHRDIFEPRVMEVEFSVNPVSEVIKRIERAKVNFISSRPITS